MDSMIKSVKEAFVQIGRNRGMSLASLFSITAMLLIFGVILTLTVNINYLTESVKTQFDTLEVFLLDETSMDQANKLKRELEARDEVASVEYVSKEDAMENFRGRMGDNAYLLDGLSENPLPNSLRVHLSELHYGTAIKSICLNDKGVEDVRFYADEVNKVITITTMIQRGALIIIAFLVIISVVVVSNTIKLTVMARQEEIAIMKFVGATNWFVRGPLLAEGILIGFISSIVALGVISFGYIKLCETYGAQAMTLFSAGFVDPKFMITNFIFVFISLGVSIGAFGSILSMRRFMQV